MKKLYVVGIGPGGREGMTIGALRAIEASACVVTYSGYVPYIADLIGDKTLWTTGMRGEIDRCRRAIAFALEGRTTAIVSTGDAALYAMAGPVLELAPPEIDVEVIPGVTAAFAAGSVLGAPFVSDTAFISLSDLLTPMEAIRKRVRLAAEADFLIALYNPRSKGRSEHLREMLDLILEVRSPQTPAGLVRHAGRAGEMAICTTLGAMDPEMCDMMTTVVIGNSQTSWINGKMVTSRGYAV